MTKKEITDTIVRVLKVSPRDVDVRRDCTHVNGSITDANYDSLRLLADALGTTDINFSFLEGEAGYSSWTPGTSSSFEFYIGIGATE